MGNIRAMTVLLLLLAWSTCALAQQPAESGGETPKQAGENEERKVGSVEASDLDAYYVKDKDGRFVPLIESIPYELLERLYNRYLQEIGVVPKAAAGPQYRLKLVEIEGKSAAELVNLEVHVEVVVMSDKATRVPLALGDTRLVETPVVEGSDSGLGYVDFDAESKQYVCWLKAKAQTTCKITLKARTRIEQIGDLARFSLRAPGAATSEFSLRVDEPRLVLVSGEQVNVDQQKGATVFSAPLHGDLELAWRRVRPGGIKAAAILRASGRVLTQVTGQGPLTFDAQLDVRSLSGPFDSFTVRLPPHTELITIQRTNADRSDLQATVRDAEEKAKGATEGKLVDVSFAATTQPVSVQVLASYDGSAPAGKAPLELAGFGVVGARFDTGDVNVAVDREWSAEFHTRDIDRGDLSPEVRASGVTARFHYSRQPYSLTVALERRKTRVTVEPVYVVRVDADRVQLEARLNYFVRGSTADHLELQMPGWHVDSITANEEVIDHNRLDPQQVAPLVIPVSTPSSEFQLTVLAHQDIEPGSDSLSFSLPRPIADTVTPAALVVSPAHNVQLAPEVEEMAGLTVDLLPPQLQNLPENRQTPLFFRDRGAGEAAQFVARFEVRPRSVTIADASRLEFDERRLRVEQTLNYRIAYEPLSAVTLEAPRMVLAADNLQISLDGTELPWTEVTGGEVAADSSRALVRADLPTGRIGPCRLQLTYSLQLPMLTSGQARPWSVPLVVPVVVDGTTTVESRTARLRAAETLRVEVEGESWHEDEDAENAAGELVLIGAADSANLPLSLTLLESQRQSSSVVRQGWVQTWITANGRRDRAAYRISTSDRLFRIHLPPSAQLDDAAVDGRRVDGVRTSADGELLIDVPAADPQRQFVVEVWYSFDKPPGRWGRSSIQLPEVVGEKWARRMYWQLALPGDQQLCFSPAGLTPELLWSWEPVWGEIGYWDRRANLDQGDLEQWLGASQQADLPSGANQYLFSTFGPVHQVDYVSASRRWLLLGASFAVLVAGLALIFVPVLRHPAVLLVGGLAVIAAGLFFSEPAIQIAQAATLGVALALAARLLNWLLVRGRGERAIVRGTSRVGRDANTTETRYPHEADSQHSTATAALAIHVSDADSRG